MRETTDDGTGLRRRRNSIVSGGIEKATNLAQREFLNSEISDSTDRNRCPGIESASSQGGDENSSRTRESEFCGLALAIEPGFTFCAIPKIPRSGCLSQY